MWQKFDLIKPQLLSVDVGEMHYMHQSEDSWASPNSIYVYQVIFIFPQTFQRQTQSKVAIDFFMV